MLSRVTALPGQETLVASWSALADVSPGARLIEVPSATAAVFPSWVPLNNAIASSADEGAVASAAVGLSGVYADAGVRAWALWVPSRATTLDDADDVRQVVGLERDTTTLVMQSIITQELRRDDRVVPVSLAAVARLDDEPIPARELGAAETAPGLAAWALVEADLAVAGAWSFVHGTDCGIYAVSTVPAWRRRGRARSMVEHALAVAAGQGARTATLQSTRMAQRVYESLGFEAVGRYEEWVSRSA